MKNYKFLKIIFGVLFLVIFIYNGSIALEKKYEVGGDALDYIHLAVSIAKTGKYGHFKVSHEQLLADLQENKINNKEYKFSGQTAFRPPVWPILVAGVFWFFGYSLSYIIIFKFLLHLLGMFIFYRTLKLFKFNELILVIGTFLYAISPAWQLYSRVFLSEPVTFFFITLWVYLLIKYLQKGIGFFPQAFVAGILILAHPYYLFLPFSVWFVLWIQKSLKLKPLILTSLIAILFLTGWIIRNAIIFDSNEVIITTSSGAVMAKGWNREVVRKHTNTQGDLADEELVLKSFDYNKSNTYNEVQRMQLYKDATIHFIKSNPQEILPIIGTKLKSAFNPFPETRRQGILESLRWIFHSLSLLAILFIIFFSKSNILRSLAIGLVLSTIAITVVTYSGFRFRMPQVALELIFITYIMQYLLLRRKPRIKLDKT